MSSLRRATWAVLRAMYAQPAFNVLMWRTLVERWEHGSAVREAELAEASAALAKFHVTCVKRYRELL